MMLVTVILTSYNSLLVCVMDYNPPSAFAPRAVTLDASIAQYQELAAQMADPGDYAKSGRSVMRNPISLSMSTTCVRDKLRINGNWADTYLNGTQQPDSLAGETWAILNQGMKYNTLVTSGTYNSLTDNILVGRMKVIGNTPDAIMFAADPLTAIINNVTHFIFPRKYSNIGAAPVQLPIYAISIPTTGSASVTRFTITVTNFFAADLTGYETMQMTFMWRNYATQVWTSTTNANPSNDFGSGPWSVNCTAGVTVDAIAWYYNNGNYSDAVYDISIFITTNAGGPPVGTIPNVAQHMVDCPLTIASEWVANSVAICSGSLWGCCTASTLHDGGNAMITDLRNKWRVGDLPDGSGSIGGSTLPWSYNGAFKNGCYGWLQPTFDASELHVPTRVFDDNCLFLTFDADDKLGDFLILVDVVFQATSISTLYEYRLPALLPGYDRFLTAMRQQAHVMANDVHKSVIKGFVKNIRNMITSPEFYKFVGDVSNKVIKYTPSAVPGSTGVRTAARITSKLASVGEKLTETPEQKEKRKLKKVVKKTNKKAKQAALLSKYTSGPRAMIA
jgi:hypothetical protein